MIRGVHTMFYSSEPDAFRAFVRDKLGFKGHDVGEGWLIFDLPEADLAATPPIRSMAARQARRTSRSTATISRKRWRS